MDLILLVKVSPICRIRALADGFAGLLVKLNSQLVNLGIYFLNLMQKTLVPIFNFCFSRASSLKVAHKFLAWLILFNGSRVPLIIGMPHTRQAAMNFGTHSMYSQKH